jgi:hypothetical protein
MGIFHRYHDYSQNTDEKQGLQNEKPVHASWMGCFSGNAMHLERTMHRNGEFFSKKRCIGIRACIVNQTFYQEKDALGKINASQITHLGENTMHTRKYMHRR